jgi:hypothetical protein
MITSKVEEIFGKGIKGIKGPEATDYEDARYLPSYVFGGKMDLIEEEMDVAEREMEYLEEAFSSFYNLKANFRARLVGVNGDEMKIAYSFGSGYLWYFWVNEIGAKSFGRKDIDF